MAERARYAAEVRRKQILDAAIHLIGRSGYHGVTVQSVARECDVSNAGLLYHFASKEELLVAVLRERDLRDEEALTARLAGVLPDQEVVRPLATVATIFRAVLEQGLTHPELQRLHLVLQAEALDGGHPAHSYFKDREQQAVCEYSALLSPHVVDGPATARAVLAMIDGLTQQWLRADGSFDLLAAWDAIMPALFETAERARPAA